MHVATTRISSRLQNADVTIAAENCFRPYLCANPFQSMFHVKHRLGMRSDAALV